MYISPPSPPPHNLLSKPFHLLHWQSEPEHPPSHHAGWLFCPPGNPFFLCCVPMPQLTNHVGQLCTNHPYPSTFSCTMFGQLHPNHLSHPSTYLCYVWLATFLASTSIHFTYTMFGQLHPNHPYPYTLPTPCLVSYILTIHIHTLYLHHVWLATY